MKKIYLQGKYKHKYAIVDDCDYDWLNKYKWYYHDGYAKRRRVNDGLPLLMHRMILKLNNTDSVIDHINHNTLDNYRSNLRECSILENTRNSKSRPGASKYKGVVPGGDRWIANTKNNGESIYLGTYNTEEEAALIYDKYVREHFGEFASLNFPDNTNYENISNRNPKWKSKYTGVQWHKVHKKWIAVYKRKHLGLYSTEIDAYEAREQYIKLLGNH